MGDLSELLCFFLQPSSYRSLPAGHLWASALSYLLCWHFRPSAWLALPRLATGFGASSKCFLLGQHHHWLGGTDHCCRSTTKFWYKELGNWFLVPLRNKELKMSKSDKLWIIIPYLSVVDQCVGERPGSRRFQDPRLQTKLEMCVDSRILLSYPWSRCATTQFSERPVRGSLSLSACSCFLSVLSHKDCENRNE